MKKLICIFLCLILAFTTLCTVACGGTGTTTNPPVNDDGGYTPPTTDTPTGEYTPITRFVVTGDVHVRENGELQSLSRLNSVFDTAYYYSSTHSSYKNLDGIFFVGDNTNNGYESEQTLFFNTVNSKTKTGTVSRAIMGNHEYYATATDGSSYSESSMQQAPIKFLEYSGYENTDAHLIIDGYHYIFLSMDEYSTYTARANEYLSQTKLNWLKSQLDLALSDDESGEKPIFVFEHVPPKDTMLGSIYYDKYLREVLNDYPNVVNFAGHTHMPMTDQRSIWQGEFTSIQTGSMAYLDLNIAGHEKYDQAGVYQLDKDLNHTEEFSNSLYRNGNMYYIVEIDENNVVKVIIYDAINEEVYDYYTIDSFGDPSGFDYTDARYQNTEKPVFGGNESIKILSNSYEKSIITFNQATCLEKVQHYRIDIYKGNTLVKTEYKLSGSYLGRSMPKSLKATIYSLEPSTTYTVKVYPVSTWAVSGNPITTTLTTTALSAVVTPEILQTHFTTGTAINGLTNADLTVTGAPSVYYDNTIGRYVGDFNGSSAYSFNMANQYDDITASMTLELYFKADAKPSTGYQDIFSNQQAGGFGFEYNSAGKVEFIICINGTYQNVQVSVNVGEWTHLVGTYDGQTIKLYKNGVLVGEKSVVGTLTIPSANSKFLCIGGDSGNGIVNNFFDGKIATANLYSSVLIDAQIENLYLAYN